MAVLLPDISQSHRDISRSHSSKTPEPIDTKFDVEYYVGNVTPNAKIQNDRPIGSVST